MSLSAVFQVIRQNLWGYDTVILIVGAGNILLFALTRRVAGKLHSMLYPRLYVPSRRRDPESLSAALLSVKEEEQAIYLRKSSESLYAVFTNITAIFPLLGILGTVISLLPMVSDLGDMQTNFFAALTSTFWGLVFAIICKFMDGFLSAKMDDNDRGVTLLMERHLEKEEKK